MKLHWFFTFHESQAKIQTRLPSAIWSRNIYKRDQQLQVEYQSHRSSRSTMTFRHVNTAERIKDKKKGARNLQISARAKKKKQKCTNRVRRSFKERLPFLHFTGQMSVLLGELSRLEQLTADLTRLRQIRRSQIESVCVVNIPPFLPVWDEVISCGLFLVWNRKGICPQQ